MPDEIHKPLITWDHGTAWDFFASLEVIFTPGDYGLRASWAAGVRSRLSSGARDTLGVLMRIEMIPLAWIQTLDEPKTARVALEALEAMEPEDILPSLALNPRKTEPQDDMLRAIAAQGSWTREERDKIAETIHTCHGKAQIFRNDDLDAWIEAWAHVKEFGAAYRAGMREFYEVFFRDEEKRIAADVEMALANARGLSERLPPRELFEELSQ
jgi:hypothetical protein